MKLNASTRIWVILARKAPIAAIFRRGPTRQVQLIKWNLADDSFEYGQWFKGRIYERRCDLSPSGTLLIYFAATYKRPLNSWTAVSRLPWFTALALWPKGDGWNGGGHFVAPYEIHLDHFPGENASHPDFASSARKLKISSYAEFRGEDSPMWNFTLTRDGWSQTHAGIWGEYGEEKGYSWKAKIPETWQKPHPKHRWTLQMSIEGINKRQGSWYNISYQILEKSGETLIDIGPMDWADWDKNGDLLYVRDGSIYRGKIGSGGGFTDTMLVDLSPNKFQAMAPPESAKSF